MSDFSVVARCPICGGQFAPDDGACCEIPPTEEQLQSDIASYFEAMKKLDKPDTQ